MPHKPKPGILLNYTRRLEGPLATVRRILVLAIFAGVSLVYGLLIALLPQQALMFLIAPLVILALIVLWMLPDWDRVPDARIPRWLKIFAITNVIWPSYIALHPVGLPWINPQRIALLTLLVAGLLKFSTSSNARAVTLAACRSCPVTWYSFIIFWLVTLLTLPVSATPFFSLSKWANNQIYWTVLFFLATWCALMPGFIRSFAKLLCAGAIITAAISVPEFIRRDVFWGHWLPHFLIGDYEIFASVMSSQARVGLDMYRARSTFTVSITFAEYLSMALPFLLHFMMRTSKTRDKLLLFMATVLVCTSMVFFTNARSGMIGFLIGLFGYSLFWAFKRWRSKPRDLIAASIIYGYPAVASAFVFLVFAWRRLHVMVLGGGQHSFSNYAREQQWDIGLARAIANPLGYGTGRAGEVIGFRNPGGTLTVDSYALTLLVDYGFVGLLSFTLLILGSAWMAAKIALYSDDQEMELGGPLAIALVSFAIIKTVLSQTENIPLMFMLAGCVCALAYRDRRVRATAASKEGTREQTTAPSAAFAS